MLTLEALFNKVVSQTGETLSPSRIAPIKTAVKQYAAILGTSPVRCLPQQYHLPDNERNELITQHAQTGKSRHTLRNLKNNISFLLKQAKSLGLLPTSPSAPLPTHLTNRRQIHPLHRGFDTPVTERRPYEVYALRSLPPTFVGELRDYIAWSTRPFAPNRPARIKKRAVTMKNHIETIREMAGFLVHHQGRSADTLTLRDFINPTDVEAFITWWINRRRKVTITPHRMLINLTVLAEHYLMDPTSTAALHRLRQQLPNGEPVLRKQERMLPPETLEQVGKAIYPTTARFNPPSRQRDGHQPGCLLAYWVQISLIVRLLVRHPIRMRNIIEMRQPQNLKPLDDGTWLVHFHGEELKVGTRQGQENALTFIWPTDLQAPLEVWLTQWRPLLIGARDPGHVFLNSRGKPHTVSTLSTSIQRHIWKFSGIRVHPHLFRDIWATHYLKSGGKAHVAARRLGNTPAMIHRYYAHLLDADADREGDQWIQQRLRSDGTPT